MGGTMPLYLTRFSYTPETWARLIRNPEDRRKAAQSYIESVGGKLHGFWHAFGTHDGYNLWEAPDNVSMAAVAMAISGGNDGCDAQSEAGPVLTARRLAILQYSTPVGTPSRSLPIKVSWLAPRACPISGPR